MDLELEQLAKQVGERLLQSRLKLAFAESCTGGLASATITSIPGSSAWFDGGVVVYSNQSKCDLLNVKESTLEKEGAVSEAVAQEMAQGLFGQGRAQITVSVTGIAGPDGGTKLKPVGMVCFAWALQGSPVRTSTQYFQGNREAIRMASVKNMLFGVLSILD
jgi:nicotinamide-nucleotide amidase